MIEPSIQIDKKQALHASAPSSQQPTHIPTSAFTPVNDLPLEIKEPIKITTSKKWVLPPRPKPGRKPVSSADLDPAAFSLEKDSTKSKVCKPEIHPTAGSHHHHHHNHLRQVSNEKKPFSFPPERNHSISSTMPTANNPLVSSPPDLSSACLSPKSSSSCMPTPSPTPDSLSPKLEANAHVVKPTSQTQVQPQIHPHPQPERRKRSVAKLNQSSNGASKKKQDQPPASIVTNSNKMIEVDCSIIHNPTKTEILKINEENYYLKLEVIRLVSNLKSLRDEIQPMVDKRKTKANRKVKKDKSSAKPSPSPLSSTPAAPAKPVTTTKQTVIKSSTPSKASTTTSPQQGTPKMTKTKEPSRKSPTPSPTATTITTTTTTTNKKRNHDDDINDLILSLIDLSHSQQTSEPKSEEEEASAKDMSAAPLTNNTSASMDITTKTSITTTTDTYNTKTGTSIKHDTKRNTEINRNKAPTTTTAAATAPSVAAANIDTLEGQGDPLAGAMDFALLASATATSSTAISPSVTDNNALRQGQHSHLQSPVFSSDIMNDPFLELSSKSLLEKQILYDEDDLDLLSTVSTTPSTMFSLSLSATNETVDSMGGSGPVLMGGLDNIDELPPFDLLNLPDDRAIAAGKLDIRLNYERSAADSKYPALDTFSLLDDEYPDRQHNSRPGANDTDIGSLELLNASDKKLSEQMFGSGSEVVDFTMPDDVDSVFDTFINGRI